MSREKLDRFMKAKSETIEKVTGLTYWTDGDIELFKGWSDEDCQGIWESIKKTILDSCFFYSDSNICPFCDFYASNENTCNECTYGKLYGICNKGLNRYQSIKNSTLKECLVSILPREAMKTIVTKIDAGEL